MGRRSGENTDEHTQSPSAEKDGEETAVVVQRLSDSSPAGVSRTLPEISPAPSYLKGGDGPSPTLEGRRRAGTNHRAGTCSHPAAGLGRFVLSALACFRRCVETERQNGEAFPRGRAAV